MNYTKRYPIAEDADKTWPYITKNLDININAFWNIISDYDEGKASYEETAYKMHLCTGIVLGLDHASSKRTRGILYAIENFFKDYGKASKIMCPDVNNEATDFLGEKLAADIYVPVKKYWRYVKIIGRHEDEISSNIDMLVAYNYDNFLELIAKLGYDLTNYNIAYGFLEKAYEKFEHALVHSKTDDYQLQFCFEDPNSPFESSTWYFLSNWSILKTK